MIFWVALTGIGVFGLLVAEAAELRPMAYVCKPLASAGFIALAVSVGAVESTHGRIMLVALALSFVGDACLLVRGSRRMFLAGLGAFLVAHVMYLVAFLLLDPNWLYAGIAMVALVVTAGAAARWLEPYLVGSPMRTPVQLYIAVVTCMVGAAAGAVAGQGHPLIIAGALGFYISDLAVAREAFVAESYYNKLWGLPLYYAGQLCLAWTAGQ